MNGYIYKITNNINEKIYIGKTMSTLNERFKEHCSDAFRDRNEKRPLYRAMRKYGIENFSIEQIEKTSLENLSDREIYWIKYYDSFHNGYNATKGGEGKQLFDYDAIVKGFLSGKLIKNLAEEFECSEDTIHNALILANIQDTSTNARAKISKGIKAKTLEGCDVKTFSSRREAAYWLQENNYTKANNIDNIVAAIGRVANGQRNSAYNLLWENI